MDPASGTDAQLDLLVEDGRIAALGEGLRGDRILDVVDCWILPGLLDLHAHLREPGFENKETLASGLEAAVRGGYTAVAAMPNTEPPADNPHQILGLVQQAAALGKARLLPVGTITRGRAGETLADMGALRRAGAVAVTDDGSPVASAEVFRRALQYAAQFGLVVAEHSEEPSLVGEGAMHEGAVSMRLGLPGIPAAAETVAVARNLLLAEATGGRLHLMHLSTGRAVEMVRQAKARGVRVTAEVTPHHLLLTAQAVEEWGYDPCTKVSPPLRSEPDRQFLLEGLLDGTIDCVATDHAPHAPEDKERDYLTAASGISGLETAFPLVLGELTGSRRFRELEVVALFTTRPAACWRLAGGRLEVGAPADVAVFDPRLEWKVEPARFASRGRNTPFAGRSLRGRFVCTLVGGRVVWKEGDRFGPLGAG